MARVRIGVEAVLLILGAGLLAGAAYAYDLIVLRPASWPHADALVISSRVTNPRGPDEYAPEIVFRLADGASTRDVKVTPSWRSNSYDLVRRHVERFPPGHHLMVAVNPDARDDVRYDLTRSVTNLIVPGILGVLGVGFTAAGTIALRAARKARTPPQPWDVPVDPDQSVTDGARVARRTGQAFVLIGVVIAVIGGLLARADLATIREWPDITGRVVDARVVPAASGSSMRRGSRRPSYDTFVTFRYSVNDVTYENGTTYGASTSRSNAEARARAYAPGTTHRIWHRPDDPNLIRFDLDRGIALFMASGGMILLAAVLIGLGGLVWRKSGQSIARIEH